MKFEIFFFDIRYKHLLKMWYINAYRIDLFIIIFLLVLQY